MSDEGEEVAIAAAAERQELQIELLRAINSDSLVVLTGLGTSLGIPKIGDRKAPTMWNLWQKVQSLPTFAAATKDLSRDLIESENIEHLLSHIQARLSVYEANINLGSFLNEAESVILEACSFVDDATSLDMHQMFLRKIGRRSSRLQRTKLFTTNYDLAFEVAAARSRFHLIDGFGLAAHREFDGTAFDIDFVRRGPNDRLVLEENVLHLLKLHGSVDWERNGAAAKRIEGRPNDPVLIYPAANKYQMSFRQPYLEMMSRFQMALRLPNVALLVVGFGFNDEHIAAPIEAAVRSNVGLRLLVVDPAIRNEAKRSQSIAWLEKLAMDGDHRLTLIDGTFNDLVRLMPDASEFDERQAHAERISRVDETGAM
ncbi:SIR2-like domain-containing protein [Arthrobacter sp. ov407]|nr:SIR2-like domain-containing protein [Arthrobacter sp. ov407]